MRSKEIDDTPNDYEEEPESLRNVLAKPPKFRAKLYFKWHKAAYSDKYLTIIAYDEFVCMKVGNENAGVRGGW